MRTILKAAAVFALLCGGPAGAQEGYQPQLGAKVRAAIDAIRGGSCPKSLMTPVLEYQCRQQLSVMRQHFIALGAISAIEFEGTQSTPSGPAEAYVVKFAEGQMLWLIGADQDGKLTVFWSPG
jgi:hypothetical protein